YWGMGLSLIAYVIISDIMALNCDMGKSFFGYWRLAAGIFRMSDESNLPVASCQPATSSVETKPVASSWKPAASSQ
ncbi:MAG: hypothetical protein PVH97_15895, partial [Desulfobacterales bacterium]